MGKSKEELDVIKSDVENLNKKLAALSEDELKEVAGGVDQNLGSSNWMDFHGGSTAREVKPSVIKKRLVEPKVKRQG